MSTNYGLGGPLDGTPHLLKAAQILCTPSEQQALVRRLMQAEVEKIKESER